MPTNWKIGNVTLPIPPESIDRRVLRKQTVDKIIEDFPFPIDTGPDSFELQMKGLIYPNLAAFLLWENIKKAEEPTTQIEVADGDVEFQIYNGKYAVNKASVKVDGPFFIKDSGFASGEGPVHKYDITFIQFADQGDLSDGDTAEFEGDETGTGLDGIEDLLGSIDFGDYIFTINNWFNI